MMNDAMGALLRVYVCIFVINMVAGFYVIPTVGKIGTLRSLRAAPTKEGVPIPEWYSVGKTQVLYPQEQVPLGVIHFIGGFLAGSLVQVTYSSMLDYLSARGYLIVATPLPAVELNHDALARRLRRDFENAYTSEIRPAFGTMAPFVPVFGMGHSLGGKLLLLGNSHGLDGPDGDSRLRYFGNIFLSFNNYGLKESIELGREQAVGAGGGVEEILRPVVDAVDAITGRPLGEGVSDSITGTGAGAGANTDMGSSSLEYAQDMVTDGLGVLSTLANSMRGKSAVVDDAADSFRDAVKNIGTFEDIQDKVQGFVEDVLEKELGAKEFFPSPEETWRKVSAYGVQRNVVMQFDADEIDQSVDLAMRLRNVGAPVDFIRCRGNHLTPNMFDTSVDASFLQELGQSLDRLSYEADMTSREQFKLPSSADIGGRRGCVTEDGNRWESDDH